MKAPQGKNASWRKRSPDDGDQARKPKIFLVKGSNQKREEKL